MSNFYEIHGDIHFNDESKKMSKNGLFSVYLPEEFKNEFSNSKTEKIIEENKELKRKNEDQSEEIKTLHEGKAALIT
jgi:hypothetical protein